MEWRTWDSIRGTTASSAVTTRASTGKEKGKVTEETAKQGISIFSEITVVTEERNSPFAFEQEADATSLKCCVSKIDCSSKEI